jgi:hypothetical protein
MGIGGARSDGYGAGVEGANDPMASTRQRQAARKNIKMAAAAATRKKTISKLPKRVRTALGKQANKVKHQRARKSAG